MKRTLIRVIQEDIDKGCKNQSTRCPVARAVHRIGKPKAAVGSSHVTFFGDTTPILSGVARSSLSIRASRFIRHFDRGHAVKPLNFYLEVPS